MYSRIAALRHDLSILYAFCRVTDDMVDNASSADERQKKLGVIQTFLKQLFSDRTLNSGTWKYGLHKKSPNSTTLAKVDWKYFQSRLTEEEMAAFRCLSRISAHLPPEPFQELCRGYEWDISGRSVESEADLIEYSEYVASSVAVLCTYVMLRGHKELNEGKHGTMIELARDIGKSLQIVNIARDIVTDSEELGRTYIPLTYMEKREERRVLTEERKPWTLGHGALRAHALKMLDLAERFKIRGQAGFGLLPPESRGPILCATRIYGGIGEEIRKSENYQKRATVSAWTKFCIVLKSIYLPIQSRV